MVQSRGKVLVVDDEPGIISALVDTLEDDYTVLTATNGREALEVIEKSMPQLVLLDIQMPEMDGLQVIAELKKRGLSVKIPVILITAKGQIQDVEKGLKAGAYSYIVKPFLPVRLIEEVNEAFDKLATRKQMKKQQ